MKKQNIINPKPTEWYLHITNLEENFLVATSFESNSKRTSFVKIRQEKNLPRLTFRQN